MITLHILGNGFDLQHGLPTNYDPHFKQLAIQGERFPGEWECYSEVGDLWSDVEENLAHPDTSIFLEHLEIFAPDMLSERESDRDGIIFEAEELLDFPLKDFVEQADAALLHCNALKKFQDIFGPNDLFLTFNYTHTLECLYKVDSSRILHLHGELGGAKMLLGYIPGELQGAEMLHQWSEEGNFDYYRSAAHEALERRLSEFEKPLQTKRMADFLNQIPIPFDQIMVYGVSFGRVDRPYFDQLAKRCRDVPWIVAAYRQDALDDAIIRLDNYGCEIKYKRRIL